MRHRDFVIDYVENMPGAVYDMPFENDFDTTVLRHERSRKWFGIIMSVKKTKVGQTGDGEVDVLNLKSNPEDSLVLFELYDRIIPAYHMNKTHWISVILDGTLPEGLVKKLVDKSFDMTKK